MIKITIEGLKDKPIVCDNVRQLFLSTETINNELQHLASCDHVFAGYIAAIAQAEFIKRLEGANSND